LALITNINFFRVISLNTFKLCSRFALLISMCVFIFHRVIPLLLRCLTAIIANKFSMMVNAKNYSAFFKCATMSNKKNGAPKREVMTPTGISVGGSNARAKKSARTRKPPPNKTEKPTVAP